MKKTIYAILTILAVAQLLTASACKKSYTCTCTYNNAIIYQGSTGEQTKKNAVDDCNRNDSTVPGEVWNCSVY